MTNIYAVAPGEVFWAASDVGWVVGHSYICYAPLLAGATTVVFEGKPVGTPGRRRLLAGDRENRVGSFFTAPTAFRAIKREDPRGEHVTRYDLSSLRYLFLAGERADPDTIVWAQEHLKVPVIDHWWQTETGWAIAANPAGIELLPVKLGSPTVAMPGYDVRILGEAARAAAGRARRGGDPAAAAAGDAADALERRRAVREVLPHHLPRLLRDRGRRVDRRGRLRLDHGAHRRRHQRRRPPAVHRRHGGGAGRPCRRGGMRGDRRGRPGQGPGPAGAGLPERRLHPRRDRRSPPNASSACATRSARSRRSGPRWRSTGCRRRAPARSCAG